MDLVGLSIKEAMPILKLAVGWLTSHASDKVKVKLQKWSNEGQIRQLAKKIFEATNVKTLWGGDSAVSLYTFYYPLKVVFDESSVKSISSLGDLGRAHHYIIQGTAGQGKSIFLRFLTGQELRTKTSSGRIPIFIELRRLLGTANLSDLLVEAFQRLGLEINDSLFDYYASSGRIVLLLDAFDEIEGSRISDTLAYLETLAAKYPDLQMIVTARPESDIQRSAAFRTVKLAPLSPSDHPHFLRRICHDSQQAKQLESAIKQSSIEIRALLTTPLLLTLLSVIYSAQQTIPDTLPGFYEQLFDVLFFKHDRSKGGFKRRRHTKLDDSIIRKLFEAFCFQARIQGKSVLDAALFRGCVQRAGATLGIQVDDQAFRNEIVRTVCLLQEEGFDLVFIHKSVAEFHAAAFIRNSTDVIAEKFFATILDGGKWRNWRQELHFLEEIDSVRYSQYFAIPDLESLAKKLKVDPYSDSPQLGDIAACPLSDQGPTISVDGDVQRLGWSRVVQENMGHHEERLTDRWLTAVSTALSALAKSDQTLTAEIRALGIARDGPDGQKQLWVKLNKLLQHPKLSPIVIQTFQEHIVAALVAAHGEALQLVHQEQQKIELMKLIAAQKVEM